MKKAKANAEDKDLRAIDSYPSSRRGHMMMIKFFLKTKQKTSRLFYPRSISSGSQPPPTAKSKCNKYAPNLWSSAK